MNSPLIGARPSPWTIRQTDLPCACGCRRQVQPGQIYIVQPDGRPRLFGCEEKRTHVR